MSRSMRKWLVAATLVGVTAFAAYTLQGPRGIQSFLERQSEIRRLQMQNSDLARENQWLRERRKRLRESESEQEQAVREHLKLLRPGEKTFILPGAHK